MVRLATLGPIGRQGKAPGTRGTLVGFVVYTLIFHPLGFLPYLLLLSLFVLAAKWICAEAERTLGQKDPPCIILDEVVATPLCFLGLQAAIQQLEGRAWCIGVLGFLLFRFFDIVKPLGIKKLEKLPGNWGIVADDLAAAAATAVCLRVILLFFFS